MIRRLLVAATALSLTACFYPSDRGRALEMRVDKLEADKTDLSEQLQVERKKVDSLVPEIQAKIAEVSQALANLDKASRRTGADTGIQLQKTIEDVAGLRGQLELAQHRLQVLEDGMKELSDSTQSKLTAMQDSQAKAEAEAKKRAEALARPKDKQGYLALARAKVKAKDVAVARTLYNEFLQKWPKDALAADAHFELGETYYDEHKCREALFEYGKVIQEFSKSKVTPEAYLHSGQCFGALGMKKESKLALEELVRSYPKSAQARQARKELAAGKKPAPKPTHHKK